jgi:glycerol-3-phosphate dehydrogenase (NAD(P)+)
MTRGENERALLFTRVWDDVVKIGVASGAQVATFLGLCGLGDLFLSATSTTSRNYSGGIAIANGLKAEGTVEGIHALCGLIERANTLGIEVPVLTEMKKKLKI